MSLKETNPAGRGGDGPAGATAARPSPQPARRVTSVEGAAAMLGISRGLAYRGVREGAIPSLRIGRRILVPIPALERLVSGEVAP